MDANTVAELAAMAKRGNELYNTHEGFIALHYGNSGPSVHIGKQAREDVAPLEQWELVEIKTGTKEAETSYHEWRYLRGDVLFYTLASKEDVK